MQRIIFLPVIALIVNLLCIQGSAQSNEIGRHQLTASKEKLQDEKAVLSVMNRHLNAVTNKDLNALKSTMSPDGEMQLILPGSEIIHSVDSFMAFHKSWFQDKSWSFETKVLDYKVGEELAMVISEITYREPERNGSPYFNRMIVSYILKKLNDKWYVIKDHASSIEKSTDKD